VELRTENPALWTAGAGGDLVSLHEEESDVIVFSRSFEGNDVIVAVNLDSNPQSQSFGTGELAGSYTEFFSGESIQFSSEATVELEPNSYKVFIGKSN
jgi:hypothetical protein